jgi:glycosyltransferase involved in cell wall biosynthesis
MLRRRRQLTDRTRRGPLRALFVTTSLDVGGMETLLVNMVRRFDRTRLLPELCCLKQLGALGEELAREIPTFSHVLRHKRDAGVVGRLARLLRERQIDAVVTVGTGGDKMFWGRLAACRAGVPVILSALHSTGLPDRVERVNRLLAPWTDGFIAVAEAHGRYIAEHEGCPAGKVFVVPNGVDVARFAPRPANEQLRGALGLAPSAPVAGIVAALRPEKQHELFLRVAARVRQEVTDAQFLVIGDGPRRSMLEEQARQLGVNGAVRFLGTRSDVPELVALLDVLVLTSRMEANPVSILEAMAMGKPVVAPAVGSIPESGLDGQTGYLARPKDEGHLAERVGQLLTDPALAARLGRAARAKAVAGHSLEAMVAGYERLIEQAYDGKCSREPAVEGQRREIEPVLAAVHET